MPESVSYRRRVPWADTDASQAWMFTAVLRYAEEAEVELLRAAGVLGELYGHLPRTYVEARFRRPAFFDDEIEVAIGLTRMGDSSLHFDFTVHRQGELAAEGRLGAAFVSDGAKASLPATVRRALATWVTQVRADA
jgi:acyl-CoA thioester hydrolase